MEARGMRPRPCATLTLQMGASVRVPYLLHFDCPEEVMEQRLLSRAASSGRHDDNIESIRKRFTTFQEQTQPVIREYEQSGETNVVTVRFIPHSHKLSNRTRFTLRGASTTCARSCTTSSRGWSSEILLTSGCPIGACGTRAPRARLVSSPHTCPPRLAHLRDRSVQRQVVYSLADAGSALRALRRSAA